MTQTGTIKAIVESRAFGFLTADGRDYFFHQSDCPSIAAFYDLREGDEVTFEPVEPVPAKGLRAAGVARLAEEVPA